MAKIITIEGKFEYPSVINIYHTRIRINMDNLIKINFNADKIFHIDEIGIGDNEQIRVTRITFGGDWNHILTFTSIPELIKMIND